MSPYEVEIGQPLLRLIERSTMAMVDVDLRVFCLGQLKRGQRTVAAIARKLEQTFELPRYTRSTEVVRPILKGLVSEDRLAAAPFFGALPVYFFPDERLDQDTPMERYRRIKRAVLASMKEERWYFVWSLLEEIGEATSEEVSKSLIEMFLDGSIIVGGYRRQKIERCFIKRVILPEEEPGIEREEAPYEEVNLGDDAPLYDRLLRWANTHPTGYNDGYNLYHELARVAGFNFSLGRCDALNNNLKKNSIMEFRRFPERVDIPDTMSINILPRGLLYLLQNPEKPAEPSFRIRRTEPIPVIIRHHQIDRNDRGKYQIFEIFIRHCQAISRDTGLPAFAYVNEEARVAVEIGWGKDAVMANASNRIDVLRNVLKIEEMRVEVIYEDILPEDFSGYSMPALCFIGGKIFLMPASIWRSLEDVFQDYDYGGFPAVFFDHPRSADVEAARTYLASTISMLKGDGAKTNASLEVQVEAVWSEDPQNTRRRSR